MIQFKTYGRKELEFPGLYTFEELLRDYKKVGGPMILYGGFSVRKTERGSLVCKEVNIDTGRLGGVSQDLFNIPEEPCTHTFWFRTTEAADKFSRGHSVGELVFDHIEPDLLEIPRISIFKDWSDD